MRVHRLIATFIFSVLVGAFALGVSEPVRADNQWCHGACTWVLQPGNIGSHCVSENFRFPSGGGPPYEWECNCKWNNGAIGGNGQHCY
jgi:hypothetical protein